MLKSHGGMCFGEGELRVVCRREPLKKAADFAQKLRNDLPIIGLISKLTTPEGVGDESGLVPIDRDGVFRCV